MFYHNSKLINNNSHYSRKPYQLLYLSQKEKDENKTEKAPCLRKIL